MAGRSAAEGDGREAGCRHRRHSGHRGGDRALVRRTRCDRPSARPKRGQGQTLGGRDPASGSRCDGGRRGLRRLRPRRCACRGAKTFPVASKNSHGVVHNAGAMPKERIETPQGHETQLACHVLGPHLMTERLLPLLRDAHGASVVFMSSGGMYTAPLSVDDMESKSGDYNGVRVYARTKRMQVVLGRGMGAQVGRRRHPRREHAPGLGRDAGRCRCSATVSSGDTAVAARHCRRRRHCGVAGRHPAGVCIRAISGTTGPSGQRRSGGSAPRIPNWLRDSSTRCAR